MKTVKKHRDWKPGEEMGTLCVPPAWAFCIERKAREMLDQFITDSDMADRVITSQIDLTIALGGVCERVDVTLTRGDDGKWEQEGADDDN